MELHRSGFSFPLAGPHAQRSYNIHSNMSAILCNGVLDLSDQLGDLHYYVVYVRPCPYLWYQ